MSERKFGDNGFADGIKVTDSMLRCVAKALTVGKPKISNSRLQKIRCATNRRIRQLEKLADLFPVYFYHPFQKALENAEGSHNSRSIKTIDSNEVVYETFGGEFIRAEQIQQRQKLEAGAEAGKSTDSLSPSYDKKRKRKASSQKTKTN